MMKTFKQFLEEKARPSPVLQKLYDSIKAEYPWIGKLEPDAGQWYAPFGAGIGKTKGTRLAKKPHDFFIDFYKDENAIKQMIDDDDDSPEMAAIKKRVSKEKWSFTLMIVLDTQMGETDGVSNELTKVSELKAAIEKLGIDFSKAED